MDFFAFLFADIIFNVLFGATAVGKSKAKFWIQGILWTIFVLGTALFLGFFALVIPQFFTKLLLAVISMAAFAHYLYYTVKSIKNYRKTYQ